MYHAAIVRELLCEPANLRLDIGGAIG